MEVIFYEREVPVKPIIDYLNAMEEESITEQVESLANVELRLQGDVASLEELAEKLQTAPVKGYRLIGDVLVSEKKLDDIDRRLSQLGEESLSKVTELMQDIGIGAPNQVLEALGYEGSEDRKEGSIQLGFDNRNSAQHTADSVTVQMTGRLR